jgi:hypothetical protein
METNSTSLKANKRIVEENNCNICNGKFSIGEDIKRCDKCGNYYHQKCWEENEGCNQSECREDTKSCPLCGKMIKKAALKCRHCGGYLDESIQIRLGPFGGNEELKKYALKASGISRTGLNIMAGIGVFIFGWLLAIVFSNLGKGGRGWSYLIPIIIFADMGRSGEPALAALAGLLYIIGWIDANRILSKYKSMARVRIAEIDSIGGNNVNLLLEKGILLYKVMREKQSAINILSSALQKKGGDATLLSTAEAILKKIAKK